MYSGNWHFCRALTRRPGMVYSSNMQSGVAERDQTVSNNLAALRGGRTVQEVARAIGVSRKTIYDAEAGTAMPRPETLAALIRFFGKPVTFNVDPPLK